MQEVRIQEDTAKINMQFSTSVYVYNFLGLMSGDDGVASPTPIFPLLPYKSASPFYLGTRSSVSWRNSCPLLFWLKDNLFCRGQFLLSFIKCRLDQPQPNRQNIHTEFRKTNKQTKQMTPNRPNKCANPVPNGTFPILPRRAWFFCQNRLHVCKLFSFSYVIGF